MMLGKRSWESTLRNLTNLVDDRSCNEDSSITPGTGFEDQYILLLEDVANSVKNALSKISALEKFVSDYKSGSLTVESSFLQVKKPKLEVNREEQPCIHPEVVEIDDDDDDEDDSELGEEKEEEEINNEELDASESTDLNLNVEGVDHSKEDNNPQSTNSNHPPPVPKDLDLTLPQMSQEHLSSDISLNTSSYGPEIDPKSREDTHSETNERYEIYVDNLDKRATESDLREVFEKEGFHNLVVSVMNRPHYSFGFVKFQSKEDFTRVLELEKTLFCQWRPIRFRDAGAPRHKKPTSKSDDNKSKRGKEKNQGSRKGRKDLPKNKRKQQSQKQNRNNKQYSRSRNSYSESNFQDRYRDKSNSHDRTHANYKGRNDDYISYT